MTRGAAGAGEPGSGQFPVWLLILIVTIASIGLSGLAGFLISRSGHKEGAMGERPAPPIRVRSDLGETFNILLLGRDARLVGNPAHLARLDGKQRNRRESAYHSDIIIVVHFDLPHRRVALVNIPRDMLVAIPGYSRAESPTDFCNLDKITHASAYGQDALVQKTVEKFCRVPIRRRVALDFDSFRMSFALLKPLLGKLTFGDRELADPDQALMFVRDRRHYPNDDIDRSRHSVLFVKTVFQRLWPKLNGRFLAWLMPKALALLGRDTDVTPEDMDYIIRELRARHFAPDSTETAVLIGYAAPVTLWSYGQTLSCYLPNYEEVDRQVDYYLKGKRDVPAPSFMDQSQKIRWPGYCFQNYDFMPETTAKDTGNLAYRGSLLDKGQLIGRDSLGELAHQGTPAESLAKRDSSYRLPPRPDTTKKAAEPRPDTLVGRTKATGKEQEAKSGQLKP